MAGHYFPGQSISKVINGNHRHKLERNPNTYLNIRQQLKDQHKIEIKPFDRTVTLLDLPKIEKKLNASIQIHHLRETFRNQTTKTKSFFRAEQSCAREN